MTYQNSNAELLEMGNSLFIITFKSQVLYKQKAIINTAINVLQKIDDIVRGCVDDRTNHNQAIKTLAV